MGLSDEERAKNLYWYTHQIYQKSLSLPDRDPLDHGYPRLKALCAQVWDAFLGHHSNGVHWILGSSAGNRVEKANSAWSAAIGIALEEDRDESQWSKEIDFDPFNGFIDISGLLGHVDKTHASVFDIFAWTENAVYALRRYNDDFLSNHVRLSRLISEIQGVCFGIFVKNDAFPRAYVLHEVLKLLYKDEVLAKVFAKQHWHHDFSRPMSDHTSLQEVRVWHRRVTGKANLQDKIIVALEIAGRRFNYDHMFKDLVGLLPADQIDATVLRAAFDQCKAAHVDRETQSSASYQNATNYEYNQIIHGYSPILGNEETEPDEPEDDIVLETAGKIKVLGRDVCQRVWNRIQKEWRE